MDIGLVKNKKRQEGERAIRHNRPIQRDANTSHSIAPKNIPNPEALQAKASPAIAARKYAKPRHDQSQKVPAGAEQISQASSSSLSTARQNNGPAISVQRGRQQDHSSYQRHSMPKNDYQGSQGSYSYQHHQNQYPGFANFTNRMPGFALSSGRQQRPPKEEAYKLAGSDGVLDPEAYKNFKPPTAHKTSTTRRTVRNPFYVTRPSHVGDPSVYTQEGLQFAQCLFNGIHDTLQPKEKARHEEWIQNHVKRWKYCPSSKPWERVPGTPGGNPSRPEIMPGGYWCRCPERKHLVTDELIGAGQGGYWLWDGEWLGPYWNDDRGLKTWQKVFKGKPGGDEMLENLICKMEKRGRGKIMSIAQCHYVGCEILNSPELLADLQKCGLPRGVTDVGATFRKYGRREPDSGVPLHALIMHPRNYEALRTRGTYFK